MEVSGLVPILRRWILVVVVATAIATLVGWRLASSSDPTYEAKADLLVGPLNTDDDTMRASSALSQTYAELATTDAVLDSVAETTGASGAELDDGVRATANGATRFLTIRARAGDPQVARDVANAVAEALVAMSEEGALRPEGQLRVIDAATAPSSPVSPSDLMIPLAAVAGLLGSITLILVFELVGDLAETAEKVGASAEAPVLTVRRRSPWLPGESRTADPLEVLATQVDLATPGARAVLVTGASERDGTDDLGRALARVWTDRRGAVVVIDCIGDAIRIEGDVDGDTEVPGPVTTAGARALVDQVTTSDRLAIVLSPSPVWCSTTLVWADVADACLLGVRHLHARRAQVRDAAANLRAVGSDVTFAVLHDGSARADDGAGGGVEVEDSSDDVPDTAPGPPSTNGHGPEPGPRREQAVPR